MPVPTAVLGVGTATFLPNYGLAPGAAPGEDLLRAAIAAGVRYLDTAADYGDGERAVGRAMRDGIRVCTKISADASIDQVEVSIERLGRPADTILMHSARRTQLTGAPALGALLQAKARGLTARTGASTYGSEDAVLALEQPWADVVQVEYSILNQSVLRAIGSVREDREVVVRSVLCKGLLTPRRAAAPALLEAVGDALEGIDACARQWGRPVEELAIRFAMDTPGVDVVLVGVSTRGELDTALAAAASPPLSSEQWTRLAAFDRHDSDAVHPERWSRIS